MSGGMLIKRQKFLQGYRVDMGCKQVMLSELIASGGTRVGG